MSKCNVCLWMKMGIIPLRKVCIACNNTDGKEIFVVECENCGLGFKTTNQDDIYCDYCLRQYEK